MENKKSKKNLTIKIIVIVIIAVVIFAVIKLNKLQTTEVSQKKVQNEYTAKLGDIKIDFIADGAADLPVTNVDFKISGTVEEIYVSSGDQVKKGDKIAKLYEDDYVENVETAQNEYRQSEIKLQQTQSQSKKNKDIENQKLEDYKIKYDDAKIDYELQLESLDKKIDDLKTSYDDLEDEYNYMIQIKDTYPQKDIDDKKVEYETAKKNYETELANYDINKQKLESNLQTAKLNYERQLDTCNDLSDDELDIESAQLNLSNALNKLETAQEQLKETTLVSPKDGTVMYISKKEEEEVITSGFKIDSATSETEHFMVLIDSIKPQIKTSISEIDLVNVELNQKVLIQFESIENEMFEGKVINVASLPQIDSNGVVTYDVTIELDDETDAVKNGMTCTLNFILREKSGVILIPNKAVKMKDGKQVVQVKDENGNIQEKIIKAGLTDGENVEVIEGLKQREKVIWE